MRPSRDLAAHRLKEGGPRIYDPCERWLLSTLDAALRLAARPLGLAPPRERPTPTSARKVLVLRLDRVGDLVMTLPALAELRRLVPGAEIELAVGSWNEEIANGVSFVDRVRIVDTPWSSRNGKVRWAQTLESLRSDRPPDLAIDFQGDVRVLLLAARAGARLRAGFGETGGGALLTHRGRWDESVSWYRQNVQLLREVFPEAVLPEHVTPYNFLLERDRARARLWLEEMGLSARRRPVVAIHPSAGRAIKQWPVDRFAALADRLQETTRGTVVLSGGPGDRALLDAVRSRSKSQPYVLVGEHGIRTFTGAIECFDVLVSGDTGPMHLAHAVGTPNVAIFGPSDPRRYGPEAGTARWTAVREELYCSPCNMIRKPPHECTIPEAPECLTRVGVERVVDATLALLRPSPR